MGEDERVKKTLKTLKVNRNLINALIERSCCFLLLSLSSFFLEWTILGSHGKGGV